VAVIVVWTLRIGRELDGRPSLGVSGKIEIAPTSLVEIALLCGLLQRNRGTRVFTAVLAGSVGLYQEGWPCCRC
jgi:hypothetical protein